jgi:hypothetical protein
MNKAILMALLRKYIPFKTDYSFEVIPHSAGRIAIERAE